MNTHANKVVAKRRKIDFSTQIIVKYNYIYSTRINLIEPMPDPLADNPPPPTKKKSNNRNAQLHMHNSNEINAEDKLQNWKKMNSIFNVSH